MNDLNFILTTQCTQTFVDDVFTQLRFLEQEIKRPSYKKKLSTLGQGYQANLYFDQPSTRTFYSFFHALSQLGIAVSSFQPGDMTSTKKGESSLDTLHTLANYSDLQVIRTQDPDLLDQVLATYKSFDLNTKLINAGSHQKEHPTQALLDVLTVLEHCNKVGVKVKDAKFLVVGDLARGRAAKSFVQIMKQYGAIDFLFLENNNYTQTTADVDQKRFVELGQEADFVYMTRVQNEYGGEPLAGFILDQKVLGSLKKECGILHPLPRREELPKSVDQDPRALYWRQEQIGLLSRMILAANLLKINLS